MDNDSVQEQVSERLRGKRILLAEDTNSMRSLIKSLLADAGCQHIAEARDGAAAWKMLQRDRYHLLITDWDMPNKSGLQLVEAVRGDEQLKHLPILMLTGSSEPERVKAAIAAGVDDYLVKPFQPMKLQYKAVLLLSAQQPK